MRMIPLVTVFLVFSTLAYADTLYLKDGTSVKGQILKTNEGYVVFKEQVNPAVTKTTNYPVSEIASIERGTEEVSSPPAQEKDEVIGEEEGYEGPAYKVLKKTTGRGLAEEEMASERAKQMAQEEMRTRKAIEISSDELRLRPRKTRPQAKKESAYEIIKCKDKSFLGFINMKRQECIVLVSDSLSKPEVKAVFMQILKEEFDLNSGLQALWITAYSRAAGTQGLPRAYGIWSPAGGWDDYRNARDRSSFKWDFRFLYD
jgi:hypothetical protein